MKPNFLKCIPLLRALPAILLLLTMSLPSCELLRKDEDPEPTPGPGDDDELRTTVPDKVVGTWANGSFDFELWENYREGYWAGRNAETVREAMIFEKNGDAKYYRYEGAHGIDELLIDCTGTVAFNDDGTFTFYPKKGRRRYYATTDRTKSDRPLTDT